MGTLVAAYLLAWAAVTTYVAWLAVQNRRLARRLEELQTLADERATMGPRHSQAA